MRGYVPVRYSKFINVRCVCVTKNAAAAAPAWNDLYFRLMTFLPGTAPSQGALDEFQMGDSYAAVTPAIVSEPASLLVLARCCWAGGAGFTV